MVYCALLQACYFQELAPFSGLATLETFQLQQYVGITFWWLLHFGCLHFLEESLVFNLTPVTLRE